MKTFERIKPALVLSVICTIICALLIVTYNLTYKDTSGIITDELRAACEKIDGKAEFALVTDREAAGLDGNEFKAVKKIVKNLDNGTFLFEVVVSGYSDNGIDAVIGFDKSGSVNGIAFVAISETPGVGTNINDDEFLKKFYKANEPVTIVRDEPKKKGEITAITGSTYSSNGLAKAVNTAISAAAAINADAPATNAEEQN